MPRVEGLAESLSVPALEGEVEEENRRVIFKKYPHDFQIPQSANIHEQET